MTAAETAQAQQAPTEAAGQELDARVMQASGLWRLERRGGEGTLCPWEHWVLASTVDEDEIYVEDLEGSMVWCDGTTEHEAWLTYAQWHSISSDMNDAMRAAEAVGLFDEGYSLEKLTDGRWAMRYVWDSKAIGEGDTPALAIARAVVAVASQRAQEGQGEGR